ncbi:MAG TPA: xanthine dehydrogenase family protein molybdopterin-binding subunit [Thermoanaerobaculia bacterium]|jgi:carbon-monoxide dehydrogenase large subunit|nr:xanthine dehydrogenase family protein molybdopterin-binding subunit [Thermoanaerobaculia bacterium]
MAPRILGSGIKRREDPRLVTGQAKYTDDIVLPGMVFMSVVRSPYGHARIKRIETKKAAAMPGVLGVYTGQQLKDAGFGPIPCAWVVPGSDTKTPPYPPIAIDIVRYTGNAVAVVVAEDPYQARDAADAVDVDYEPLPVVVDGFKATLPKAPRLHEDVPNNVCFHWHVSGGDVEAAFKSAEVIVKDHIINQRLIPNAMEPRGAVAQYLRANNEITLWSTTQNPHIARFLISLDTGTPEHKIRVIAPEVGGGFGSKIPHYPEDSMAIFASKMLNRPVKWTESRSENYRATIHGRDHIQDVELAAMKDGTIIGLRAKVWANLGAYLSTASTGIPTILHGLMLSGVYKIPNIHEDVYGVFTNTTPVDAYRGAGRPEATFMVERMIDLLAHKLAMDPVALRRKNMIPPFTDGYQVATGLTYDTGNYEGALAKALEMAGYEKLRKQQKEMRAKGEYLGIGICTYAEICGLGPSQVAGAVGFGGGLWESAIVRFHPSGKVNVMVGISPHGQGEETTFAQIVANELGVDVDDVEITHGDTEKTPMGWGTYGSRGTAVGSGALMGAIAKIKDKAKTLTAHLLEASVDDIEYADGKFFVRGSPSKSKSIQDVALMANVAWNMPKGLEPGLEASSFFDPANFVYPFGAHIAVVKVDPETGEIALQRYVAVDDCGKVINPMIVAGQIHGGIAQGMGQALWEGAVYDDDGQLLSGSMMDYAVPKAAFFPKFELAMTETLTTVNPLGVKGIGETGTIASTPAVYNAVADALAPLGVKTINMPLTPERVWRAIREARS